MDESLYICIHALMHTVPDQSLETLIFVMFLKEVFGSSSLHLFGHKYSKNSNIVKNNNSLK